MRAGGSREQTTADTVLRGRVTLFQPIRGFRTSLDPVLLAKFLPAPYGRVLDIGCGNGVLAFLLLAADVRAAGVAVEIQPRLARLAEAGRDRNGFAGRLEVLTGDVRQMGSRIAPASFDLVATNPPFRPLARGRPSPDTERALATSEVTLALEEWLDVAAHALRPDGRVGVVYAAERAAELLAALSARRVTPIRLRCVHPRSDRPAVRVLVEARRGARAPLRIEPPLVLHEGRGFTAEARRLLGED